MARVLVVDDDEGISWGISQCVTEMGHEVATASSAEAGLESASQIRPSLVILDVRLPGMDGLSAMRLFRQTLGDIPIVVITAYGDLDTAVTAVRNGAFDYILKPFDLQAIENVIRRAVEAPDVARDAVSITALQAPHGMIGSSPAMQDVFKQLALAATSYVGVLLQGESGTGKELAARAIHEYGVNSSGPFVPVNVAALSPTLIESELFGHTRGAFTGADGDHVGLLVAANGGTLFLDEVAEMPTQLQVKLLRCLEHGEVTPVGATSCVRSNFRIISATHQDLNELVDTGEFRHDLFYRLGSFKIELPPLRARRSDIVQLANEFAKRGANENAIDFSSEAINCLKQRLWPGNVRELRNVVEHAVLLSRGNTIQPEHLPQAEAGPNNSNESTELEVRIKELLSRWADTELGKAADSPLHADLLRLVESPVLQAVIDHFEGQYSAAARRLGIHRTTLKRRLEEQEYRGGDANK